MRPLIGLNTGVSDFYQTTRLSSTCNMEYIDAVIMAGGVPVLVPPYEDAGMLAEALAPLHGVIFIGGPDYHPESYGGRPQPEEELLHRRRHDFDIALGREVIEKTDLPVVGICGGHQLINIVLGGRLVQDIASEWTPPRECCPAPLLHANPQRKGTPLEDEGFRHVVRVTAGSAVARMVGGETVETNSYHHQAVHPTGIAPGMTATAWAPDGVIEAIEPEGGDRLLVGIQWHPERQRAEPPHLAIFKELVCRAAARM